MVQLNLQLPQHFLDGETRDGYYVSPEMKKVWAVELDLLNEFMRVCKKHNLKWFADGGTILGAVRHKGFIPWDDDIDVMMMRDEYEKLCKIAPSEFTHPYFWQTEETDPGYMRFFARLRNSETTGIQKREECRKYSYNQGIFIDIFPIDNIPDDNSELASYTLELKRLQSKMQALRDLTLYFQPKKGVKITKRIKWFCKHLLYETLWKSKSDYRRVYYEKNELIKKYAFEQTERVSKLVFTPQERRHWNSCWLCDNVTMDFEFLKIPLPKGYEELLDKFYGDWHTFVIGANNHGNMILDADRSWKEYVKQNCR